MLTVDMPLQGVRILDLTMVLGGPTTTQIMGDMGAEVIKIESPTRYDPWRGVHRRSDASDTSYNRAINFNQLNRNKLGLALNLNTPEGVGIFKRLVAVSDVVIENYSPRVMRNFGLAYSVVSRVNPQIIFISIPGLGSTGPYRDWVVLGPGIDAMSGLQSLTGYPDVPLKAGAYTDQTTGFNAVIALLACLYFRRRTGQGQQIEVSMREAVTPLLGEFILQWGLNRAVPARAGSRSPRMVQGCYPCKGEDRWVVIALRCDEDWERFKQALGNPPWCADPRFSSGLARLKNQDALDDYLKQWTQERTQAEVVLVMQGAGVPAGRVADGRQLLEDPQLRELNLHREGVHPESGKVLYTWNGFELSATPGSIRRPAPLFGQHNDYVLRDLLAFSDGQIAALAEKGVTGDRPIV